MVIKIINLDKCIKAFKGYEKVDLTPEITEATRKVHRSARDFAPVYPSPKVRGRIDPTHVGGNLKASIHMKVKDKGKTSVTGVVYTTTNYAVYQEFGTRYQEGTPFMIPAMNKHRAGIHQSMKKYLREELPKV